MCKNKQNSYVIDGRVIIIVNESEYLKNNIRNLPWTSGQSAPSLFLFSFLTFVPSFCAGALSHRIPIQEYIGAHLLLESFIFPGFLWLEGFVVTSLDRIDGDDNRCQDMLLVAASCGGSFSCSGSFNTRFYMFLSYFRLLYVIPCQRFVFQAMLQ